MDRNLLSDRFLMIVSLLIAFGAPTAGGIAFRVTQDPAQAIGVAIIYGLAVLNFGFVAKVWQRLEDPLAENTAIWLKNKLLSLVAKNRTRYLQHLIYRHRDFDVKGLTTQGIYTLELDKVFVELTIAPQPVHKSTSNPLGAVQKELRQGSQVIWEYLNAKQIAKQNLVIIGPPGSGKTTLLKHMTLILASNKKQRQQVNTQEKLPILLFLRNHTEAIINKKDFSLPQAVYTSLAQWQLQTSPGWLESQLIRGRCLVMLDGLDEVADFTNRRKVAAWVEQQIIVYPKNRFVITSRPHGYRMNPLNGVALLEVKPFTNQQVQRFVNNWYLANEIMSSQKDDPGVRMAAQEGANDLLQRIRNSPALSDLAVNPLLLTMIATVHRYRSTLPGRRVELYAEICEVFLGKRQQARGLNLDLTPAQKQRILQPLAHHMMVHQQREISLADAISTITEPLQLVNPDGSPKDFLKMVENSSGLLLERENDEYSFAHLTFQEYLAAVHIRDHKLEKTLAQHVGESWWHESIRLYSAQADATPIVIACLASNRPSVLSLTLAIDCMEEAHEVHPALRTRFEDTVKRRAEDADPEQRQLVAEALLALRLRRLRRINENKYIDDTLITHAEYQLFLEEQLAKGKCHHPDHWLNLQFQPGQGLSPVTGVRPSDAMAFCNWLDQRADTGWHYRIPSETEVNIGRVEIGSFWVSDKENKFTLLGPILPKKTNAVLIRRLGFDLNPEIVPIRTDISVILIETFTTILDFIHNLALDLSYSTDSKLMNACTHTLTLAEGLARIHHHCNNGNGTRNTYVINDAVANDLKGLIKSARNLANIFNGVVISTDEADLTYDFTNISEVILEIADVLSHITKISDQDIFGIIAIDLVDGLAGAYDLFSALAIDGVSTEDIVRTLGCAQGDIQFRKPELTSDLFSVRNEARGLAGTGFLSRTKLLRDRDLGPVPDLAGDLANALANVDLNKNANSLLSRVSAFSSEIEFAIEFERALKHRKIMALCEHNFLTKHFTDFTQAIETSSLGMDANVVLVRAETLYEAVDRFCNRTYKLEDKPNSVLDVPNCHPPQGELLQTRLVILDLALGLFQKLLEQSQSETTNYGWGTKQNLKTIKNPLRELFDTLLDWYINFAILEERIQGNLSAIEGIRIIRERK